MESLTKESLNNQIVTMRNLMKKVKVLTITGLIKKCRRFKKSPHSVGQKPLKKDQKVDRLLMEIHEIKKLNADEITKYALTHIGTFSEVAKQGSIKDRALARLAEHKLLTTTVSQFRTRYPKWQVQVPSLFHIWEFNKKVMGKNLKPTQKDETKSRKPEEEKLLKTIKCSKKSNKEKTKTIPPKPAVSKGLLDGNDQNDVATKDTNDFVNRPSLTQLSKNLKSKRSQDLKKTEGEMEIQRFNLNEDVGIEIPINKISKTKPKSDADAIPTKSKVRNSFFITSDNEDSVLSTDEVEKDNFDFGDDNNEQVQLKKRFKGATFSRSRTSFHVNTRQASFQKKDPRSNKSKRSTKPPPRILSNAENRTQGKAVIDSTNLVTPNLHPSWEAKRKQSSIMSVAFEGKKTTFEDD